MLNASMTGNYRQEYGRFLSLSHQMTGRRDHKTNTTTTHRDEQVNVTHLLFICVELDPVFSLPSFNIMRNCNRTLLRSYWFGM